MPPPHEANEEPLPGYRLVRPLGRGGFGEVWKCEVPGGLLKAIKFVRGRQDTIAPAPNGAAQELRALELIRTLRHPFLLSTERVEVIDGDLVIVMELADRSLHDLLQECRETQRPGIPRDDLIFYLREVAEVLDLMNLEHGLQHLDVKPRNIFLVGRHVKVADFGLVSSLTDLGSSGGEPTSLDAITPLYAAPELFLGQITPSSDQYSLAITYHELLTGTYPFTGKNFQQLALQHTTSAPNLTGLPESDRVVLARALAKEPRNRFHSCSEFIEALASASGSFPPTSGALSSTSIPTITLTERARASQQTEAVLADKKPRSRSQANPPEERTKADRPSTTSESSGLLPGYKFLECQGRSTAGEVWRACDSRGETCLIRFVTEPNLGSGPDRAPEENPVERLQALRHPILTDLEIQPAGPGRFAVITDPGDFHLGLRLKACHAQGQPGIPRQELLDYLCQVAVGLDGLFQTEGLCHLALSPRQILLTPQRTNEDEADNYEVTLLDFGLAELFWFPGQGPLGVINPRYAPVEALQGTVCETSDQYTLALIFQEMLLGLHPFRNLNARQLASPRLRGQPDFVMLPVADRAVLAKALNPDPQKRFENCLEFVLALMEETSEESEPTDRVTAPWQDALPQPTLLRTQSSHAGCRPLNELVSALGKGYPVLARESLWYQLQDGRCIEHRCVARLVPAMALLKLDGFRQEWDAEQSVDNENGAVYSVRGVPGDSAFTRGNFFQNLFGRVPSLEVEIHLRPTQDAARTPVLITLRPVRCSGKAATRLLEEVGMNVLFSLQTHLQSTSEQADQERYPFHEAVVLWPVGLQGRLSRSLSARGCDLGRQGITVLTADTESDGLGELVEVQLKQFSSQETFRVPGRVRSRQARADGQVELEIDFEDR